MQHRTNKIAIQHYVDIFDFSPPPLYNKLSACNFIGMKINAGLQCLYGL
jgi:hypothetical protein